MNNIRPTTKKDLKILKKHLDYTIIRNYEFLFNEKDAVPRDLDLITEELSPRVFALLRHPTQRVWTVVRVLEDVLNFLDPDVQD